MDRTVPSSGNEEIDLYLRTYYSLLRSTNPVQIKTLEEAHKRMHSALHVHANDPMPDMAAFTYAILRMPDCLHEVKLVLMGQSARVFRHHGFDDVETWQPVSAPGRRRRSFFDGESTLALYIASRSDIDDIIPILTAYQIEREKLQRLMNMPGVRALLHRMVDLNDEPYASDLQSLSEMTGIAVEDLGRVNQIWGKATAARLPILAYFQRSSYGADRSLALQSRVRQQFRRRTIK